MHSIEGVSVADLCSKTMLLSQSLCHPVSNSKLFWGEEPHF